MSNSHRAVAPLDEIERQIVDHLFVLQPSYAIGLGLHEYDGKMPDLSPEATDRWGAEADRLLARLRTIGTDTLPSERRIDRFLLELLLESPLFDLRDAHELDRNPMSYVGSVSLTSYLARDYAPVEQRVASIEKVLRGVPLLLAQGRARLREPLPRPFVELALAIGGGLSAHFGEAEEFAARAHLGSEVAAARAVAEEALTPFLVWLREQALPRAVPEFALGSERFQRLLYVREGIEAPFE